MLFVLGTEHYRHTGAHFCWTLFTGLLFLFIRKVIYVFTKAFKVEMKQWHFSLLVKLAKAFTTSR